MPKHKDTEVDIVTDGGKAFVEGKTSVSFQTFVQLILQKKVMKLLKDSAKEPVIVNTELLSDLASAPGDSQENRTHLIMVTLGVGILVGIFLFSLVQVVLLTFGPEFTRREYLLIAGVLVGLTALTAVMSKLRRRKKGQRLVEIMESLAGLLSK